AVSAGGPRWVVCGRRLRQPAQRSREASANGGKAPTSPSPRSSFMSQRGLWQSPTSSVCSSPSSRSIAAILSTPNLWVSTLVAALSLTHHELGGIAQRGLRLVPQYRQAGRPHGPPGLGRSEAPGQLQLAEIGAHV